MRIPATALAISTTLCLAGCGADARGRIQNKGSDTLVVVAQAWAENYKNVDPSVGVAVSGGGSGVGITALINGTVDLANASRRMKPIEIEQARAQGIEPVEHIVGYDAIAVYVHKDNPAQSFTLAQLADIYGENAKTERWSQIGITVAGTGDEIVRVSRQNNSGTFEFFRKAVLGKGNYKLGSRDMHGSKDVVELVGATPGAIGYSGLAYANDHVRIIPVNMKDGEAPITPTQQTAVDGTYPIARPLLMYTAGQPTGKTKKYLDWILSDEGQRILMEEGYAPVRKLD